MPRPARFSYALTGCSAAIAHARLMNAPRDRSLPARGDQARILRRYAEALEEVPSSVSICSGAMCLSRSGANSRAPLLLPLLQEERGTSGGCAEDLHRAYSHGLPGRVEVQCCVALLAAADTRLLVPPERHLELDASGRHVDVHESALRTLGELVGV